MPERTIAFSRNINTEWLNAVAQCYINGYSREDAAAELNSLIAQSISSADNIRKTKTILLRVWYDAEDGLRSQILHVYGGANQSEKLALHWALLLCQFPIFCDLCDVIGHLFERRDTLSLRQVKVRIFEKWGERSTLVHSLSKNMQTLKDIGAITPVTSNGEYYKCTYTITNPKIAGVLVTAILIATNQKYLSWAALVAHPLLFPFKFFHVDEADMAALEFISLERMGNEVVMTDMRA